MLSQLVAGFGTSSFSAFKILNSRMATLRESFVKQPEVERAVDHLRANIGKAKSLDDLMDDHQTWQAATTAFGLGENAYAKGMFRKLLNDDRSDRDSMINRMVDSRYKEMAEFFKLDTMGTANFKDAKWVEKLVDKFVTRAFENAAGEGSEAVQTALYFQRKAPDITNFYQILGDKKLYEVVRSAHNLPRTFSNVDVDRQVEVLKSKMSISDFKSPAKIGRMIERHLALSDAQALTSGGGLGNSTAGLALQTFTQTGFSGFGSVVSIDPTLFLKR